MSNLNILEGVGKGSQHKSNGASIPMRNLLGTIQNVSFTTSDEAASAVANNVFSIRLCSDVTCRIKVNATVTNTTGVRLPANSPEWWEVEPGDIIHVVAE